MQNSNNNRVTKTNKPQRQTNDQLLKRKNKQKIVKQARKKARHEKQFCRARIKLVYHL